MPKMRETTMLIPFPLAIHAFTVIHIVRKITRHLSFLPK